MEDEGVPEEVVVANDDEQRDRRVRATKKIVGLIVAVILVILAQRDLRRRPAELVRGRVGVWKVVAMAGPGALTYLLFGRRRAAPTLVTTDLNDV
jgi:hypothetical protein